MKCQILFSGKNKKNIPNLSSGELAKGMVKVKSKELTFSLFLHQNLCCQYAHSKLLMSAKNICFQGKI